MATLFRCRRGRRDLRAHRLRRGDAGRLRQRARRVDAGLIIGVIQAVSAYWLGADLQGRRRLRAVRRAAVVPAARPDGEGVTILKSARRVAGARRRAAALSGHLTDAVLRDMGATLLLAAIGASAWNIVGGYAGQVSVGHAMFFGAGAYVPLLVYTHWGCRRCRRAARHPLSLALALVIGMPTFRLHRPLFQHGDDRGRRADPHRRRQLGFRRRAIGLQGPATARGWWT